VTAPAAAVLLVVPSTEDRPWNRRLVTVAAHLADRPGGVHVLAWHSGPLVAALAEVAPVTDAGVVNSWRPAVALSRARLAPAARLAKNRRLRTLLAPVQDIPVAIVGGPDGLDALAWLDGSPRSAVLVPPGASMTADAADRAGVDLVVAPDPRTHRLLREDGGVATERLRNLALLEDGATDPTTEGAIGLVGWSPSMMGRLLAGLVPQAPDRALVWFGDDEATWGLWQGPTASPFATRLHTVGPQPTRATVRGLRLVLADGDDEVTLGVIAAARALGIPVAHGHGPDPATALAEAVVQLADPAPVAPTGWTLGLDAGLAALTTELIAANASPAGR